MKPSTILVVDDERNIRRALEMILSGEGYGVICAEDGKEALRQVAQGAAHASNPSELRARSVDLVLLDVVLPDVDGIEVLDRVRASRPEVPVIMISGQATIQDAVRATRLGAYDFLEKPLSKDKVLLAVRHALERRSLTEENRLLREQVEGRSEMIGESAGMKEVRRQISRVAPTHGRVLILGESGTGKELIARAIHRGSPRREMPFVRVNCAAIPDDLIESVLFGSEKGAYTGAIQRREGKFALADGGTLFLDEVGDMSLKVQAKVLRALESSEFERVGGSETLRADVRVIAATNKDLEREMRRGTFREDLYFRLHVVPIAVPPLRDRRADIPLLVEHFLRTYTWENGVRQKRILGEAMEVLIRYDWPGNIRQLKNLVERLAIMTPSDEIGIAEFPLDIWSRERSASGGTLKERRVCAERAWIRTSLERNDWNVSRAARALGIERSNLHKKMRSYGIERHTNNCIADCGLRIAE